jgi:hypothetical protein
MNAPNISFSSPSIFPSIRKPICSLHLMICLKLKHCILYEQTVSSVQTPLLRHIVMWSHCHCITSTGLLDSSVHLIMEMIVSKISCIWNTPQTMNNVQHNICININSFNLCTTRVKYHIRNCSPLTLQEIITSTWLLLQLYLLSCVQ